MEHVDDLLRAARQARKGVEQVRRRLLAPTPEVLNHCSGPLSEAIHCMTEMQESLRLVIAADSASCQELRYELASLRKELKTVGVLMQHAGAFYQGYGRLLGQEPETAEAGYGGDRRAAAPQAAPHFTLHG